MAIKVVQGFVGKQGVDQQRQVQDTQQPAANSAPTIPAAVQSTVARAIQNNDAVITTLRSVARGKAEGVSVKPIKDDSEAKEVAKEVSEKIRGDKDEALATHDGLSSTKSGAVLVS